MDREDRLRTIVDHYGADAQKLKCIEELTELQEIIIKDINKGSCPVELDEIYSEVADAIIMLLQIQLIYKLDSNCTEAEIDRKLCRQIERISNETPVL